MVYSLNETFYKSLWMEKILPEPRLLKKWPGIVALYGNCRLAVIEEIGK